MYFYIIFLYYINKFRIFMIKFDKYRNLFFVFSIYLNIVIKLVQKSINQAILIIIMSEYPFLSVFLDKANNFENETLIRLLNIYFQCITNKFDIILLPCLEEINYKFFFDNFSFIYVLNGRLNELMTDFIKEIDNISTVYNFISENLTNLYFSTDSYFYLNSTKLSLSSIENGVYDSFIYKIKNEVMHKSILKNLCENLKSSKNKSNLFFCFFMLKHIDSIYKK